ncbi:MAG: hypothetical protein IJ991_08335 [Thermoguttaceae bacterium]|nr:hypothetical protein [Thermoguttaceae bacterium]
MKKRWTVRGIAAATVALTLAATGLEINACVGWDEARPAASESELESRSAEGGGAPFGCWRVDGVEYRFDGEGRRVGVSANGTTLELEGFGVDFLWNGATLPASELETRCVCVERSSGRRLGATGDENRAKTRESSELSKLNGRVAENRGIALNGGNETGAGNESNAPIWAVYETRPKNGGNAKRFELTVDRAPEDGVNRGALRICVRTETTEVAAVRAGTVKTEKSWRRFCVERYAEAYAQPFWPRTAFFVDDNLFLSAKWSLDGSAGTRWSEDCDQRFNGSNDFEAAPAVLYEANVAGERSAVDETLILRVGTDLWETVGRPAQRPSEYFDELKNAVYLDFWGGTAKEAETFITKTSTLTGGRVPFLTVFQNWEAGGWDALLPDSIRLPDFPPNPAIGTIEELASLAKKGKDCGRFALRTNYMFLRENSPSYREGAARFAVDAAGKPRWHIRLADVAPILERQEAEIARLFAPNANFSDQLTSGAAPWAYLDFAVDAGTPCQIGAILTKEREIARRLKETQAGPLGSESLMDEHLLGEFVDFGDYGIYDGFRRALTPEFKLRRLNKLTIFYGVGLMYRFFELPPFPDFCALKRDYATEEALRDDYRAVEILFGNGGYVFYEPTGLKRTPWNYFATEIALVGTLQRRYVGEEIAAVEYWDAGTWRTLAELLERGVEPTVASWNPQPTALRCVKVVYKNGLRVLVNRLDEAFDATTLAPELADVDFGGRSPIDFSTEIAETVQTARTAKEAQVGEVEKVEKDAAFEKNAQKRLILPKSGWVAWTADGAALAFSGVLTEPQAEKAGQTEAEAQADKARETEEEAQAADKAEQSEKEMQTEKTEQPKKSGQTEQKARLTAQNGAEFSGRVDFIDDATAGVRYVDPRDGVFEGRSTPTLWLDGEIVPGWDAVDWEYGGKADAARD